MQRYAGERTRGTFLRSGEAVAARHVEPSAPGFRFRRESHDAANGSRKMDLERLQKADGGKDEVLCLNRNGIQRGFPPGKEAR